MRRKKSSSALADVLEPSAAASSEAAATALEDLAVRTADAAQNASAALEAAANGKRATPRRRRHRLRSLALLAGLGGAVYAAVRAGVPAKVRTRLGGGGEPPRWDGDGFPTRPPEPSIDLRSSSDGEADDPVRSAANGAVPEHAHSDVTADRPSS